MVDVIFNEAFGCKFCSFLYRPNITRINRNNPGSACVNSYHNKPVNSNHNNNNIYHRTTSLPVSPISTSTNHFNLGRNSSNNDLQNLAARNTNNLRNLSLNSTKSVGSNLAGYQPSSVSQSNNNHHNVNCQDMRKDQQISVLKKANDNLVRKLADKERIIQDLERENTYLRNKLMDGGY